MNIYMLFLSIVSIIKFKLTIRFKDHNSHLGEYIDWLRANSNSTEKYITSKVKRIKMLLDLIAAPYFYNICIKQVEGGINKLIRYPKNAQKNQNFIGLAHIDIYLKNLELLEEPLSGSTIKGIIESCSSYMEWCKERGYTKSNPFKSIKRSRLATKNTRNKFSNDDLKSIFNHKVFKQTRPKHTYYHWIPLLLRYTGARLNEVCSLYTDDIVFIKGIACISINNDSDDKKLKNICSRRFIPIHSELIRLGFLDFVKGTDNGRIFKSLKPINGYYSNSVSDWFSRIRSSLNMPRDKTAHSFRHTFVDELYQNEVPEEVIMNMVGHGSSIENKLSITRAVYGNGFEPSVYKPYIESIDSKETQNIQPVLK
ncbi:TPA: site-specific integrase [Vibrio harveyi]|nr:site-specific integrase [Vibrio harveyi]HDM8180615.1 site-specific integrase [Vibrio harveyi]